MEAEKKECSLIYDINKTHYVSPPLNVDDKKKVREIMREK